MVSEIFNKKIDHDLASYSPGKTLELVNNWVPYSGGFAFPRYAVNNGVCTVSGLIKGHVWGHVATLPAECRPGKVLIFNLNNNEHSMRVDVYPSGNVIWVAGGKTHSLISLDVRVKLNIAPPQIPIFARCTLPTAHSLYTQGIHYPLSLSLSLSLIPALS